MNKQDLIRKIADGAGIAQKDAAAALDSTLDAIVAAVVAGEKVQLVGFGTFEVKKRSARVGRNPTTNAVIEIPESTVPVFKAGKAFKDAVK
ncbi:HB [uncultured Flavonifractor sp.]|nr:nucleoid DNA-binding protein [Flavonifractor plautii]SCJ59355.1 HB [uncultured Flavonifractor sp.]